MCGCGVVGRVSHFPVSGVSYLRASTCVLDLTYSMVFIFLHVSGLSRGVEQRKASLLFLFEVFFFLLFVRFFVVLLLLRLNRAVGGFFCIAGGTRTPHILSGPTDALPTRRLYSLFLSFLLFSLSPSVPKTIRTKGIPVDVTWCTDVVSVEGVQARVVGVKAT